MAGQTHIVPRAAAPATVRMASPEFDELCSLVFRRHPELEWATFARFGWRDTASGLILTLAAIDSPRDGDLDETVGHVKIDEAYTLRTALASESHPLAVGIIHSHPEGCRPEPSSIDDDMDGYYGPYFHDFAPGRPYVSLIFSKIDNELALSGRVLRNGQWVQVGRFAIERTPTRTWIGGRRPPEEADGRERTARLNAAFGDQAAHRLRRSTVAVIGAGGTGSAAIETLARAGVGKIIMVDPDFLDESNLERVHGSSPVQAAKKEAKVSIARNHVLSIDPTCQVEAYVGALPQPEILDAVVAADVALGCTDQHHSRLALSDITVRYLVPSLDCGVMLEGRQGRITGQILQIVRFLAGDPCPLCRRLVDSTRLSQELMSEQERSHRRAAAAQAIQRGEDAHPYWHEQAQLNTVGYLTTIAGAMVAGYAIGWLTGRFDPPFDRLQLNLAGKFLDVTDSDETPRTDCVCRRVRGWADQATADALITAPSHWPTPRRL
jgi:molybdopterin/thiamine biosynthesis adenylyltransferase